MLYLNDEELNVKWIIEVMDASFADAKRKLELGAPSWLVYSFGQSIAPVSQRLMVRIPYQAELYKSGFLL